MSATKPGEASGLFPVLAAVSGNTLITIAKFIGFLQSGSATLFAEVIHSVADVANQFLLFIGIKKSMRAPDEVHVYGYGQERFVWALISACGVFFIGAGATIYHGIHTLTAPPEEVHVGWLTIGLLIFSFVVEVVSVGIAIRELKAGHPTYKEAFTHGDPSTIAIVYEDGVALLGIVIALVNLYLVKLTGWVVLDAIGSIVVGVMLGIMAIVLINKNRSYLIEKAMPADDKERVLAALKALPIVDEVVGFKSTTVSLDEYRVSFEASLNGEALIKELYSAEGVAAEYGAVGSEEAFVAHSEKLAHRVAEAIGDHIDEIERQVKAAVPEVKHIDIVVR